MRIHSYRSRSVLRRLFESIARRFASGERRTKETLERRVLALKIIFFVFAAVLIVRLAGIQIAQHRFYEALASGQHEIYRQLFPVRGEVFVRDRGGDLYPIAANRSLTFVWADPRAVENPTRAAKALADTLGLDELVLKAKLEQADDPYEPILHGVSDELVAELESHQLPGIHFRPETNRYFPEQGFGGHVTGFLGSDAEGNLHGRYGFEGYYNDILSGVQGFLEAERDPAGRLIAVGSRALTPAEDGADLVLTIDRTVQVFACERLRLAVERHGADGGSIIILDPKTGAVIAICGVPDFDPNAYNKVEDIYVYNNPATFAAYEPGSVFKAITMAVAIDTDAVGPETTYTDTGEVKIGPHTIRNSDKKAHGVQTMTQVLEESLNTGAIFAMRETGADTFREYVSRFGFGETTGIDLDTEVAGDISALKERGDIYSATASFGQGITVTPLQLAVSYAALANGGKLMRPYVVHEMRRANGETVRTEPVLRRQVISERTATLIDAMLVSVVERGHGKRAGVPGYYIAGKTGTAQVPRKDGRGYESGVTIGTFAGFGPVEDPRFVMVTRIDHPRDVQFAESSAAPLFGEIAKFLLQYYQVPPSRPVP